MKRYIQISLISLIIVFTACEDGNEIFDQIQSDVQRGAILRTTNLISNELPIGESDANFAVELEVQDQEDGDLLDRLDVFVGFRDNVVPDGGVDKDTPEALFTSIPASEFVDGEFGLPRTTVTISLAEMLAFTGVTEADLFGGDQFTVRFELVLTDGRTFSNDDNSGTITGSFFNSPFLYTPTVICPIPEGAFTGSYELVQTSPGIFGAVFQDGIVEISADGQTARDIAVTAYPQFGGFARNFLFDMICGEIQVVTVDTGLSCGGPNIVWRAGTATTTYDPNDDSVIMISFFEEGGGCGADADGVTFTLTKQ